MNIDNTNNKGELLEIKVKVEVLCQKDRLNNELLTNLKNNSSEEIKK